MAWKQFQFKDQTVFVRVLATGKGRPDDHHHPHRRGLGSNPGPAGIGVFFERPDGEILEHSEFIGEGTNNIAELTAILRALEMLKPEELGTHVLIYTDSAWSLGVLVGGWKAKANLGLITAIGAHGGHAGRRAAQGPRPRRPQRQRGGRRPRDHGGAPREHDDANAPPSEAPSPP
ncbi:RNase H family protein [Nannocystis sp.]|uniref:ribonuclease HI n=1 Tax=Nannocystis sp. TaxID=1962667 RepID=UPI0025CF08D0|nr:RNase H family protein [Nannocystis sp.]MBK7826512.1 hypothetical protein [Nannocystis sp.]